MAQRKTPDDGPGDDKPDDAVPGGGSTPDGATPDGATQPVTGDVGDGTPEGAPGDGTPGDGSEAGSTPAAAPLDPPAVRARRPVPSPVVAEPAAATREIGGGHVAIVDHDGNILGPDDLFTDPGGHATYVVATQRIYQQFRYPNTIAPATQLLYAAGVRVPRDQAEQLRHTASHAVTADAGGG